MILLADVEANGFLEDATKLWCIAVGEPGKAKTLYADQQGYPSISEGLKTLSQASKIIFHNGLGYDFWVINKLYPGTIRFEQIIDTLVLSRMIDPENKRHSLKDWGLELGKHKGEWNDFSAWHPDMGAYCLQDVEVLDLLWARFKPYYDSYPLAVDCEHKVYYIIAMQEQHGFRFDVKAARELEAELRTDLYKLEKTLQRVFPPKTIVRVSEKTGKRLADKVVIFNPGSRQQIAERLMEKYKWKPKVFTPSGQPQVDESTLGPLPWPEAQMMVEYLTLKKKLGQLADGDNAWLKLEKNGRIHGRVNPVGTRTHRMSHWKPNLAQVDKDERMRKLFLPDEGHVLVGCDAEGLELRMLAHYLARYDGGAYADTVVNGKKENKSDVHSVNQRIAGLASRDSAKTVIYAMIYGGGDEKLGEILADDQKKVGRSVEEALSKAGRSMRLRLESGITGFGEINKAAKKAHKARGSIVCLDGRPVKSASEHSALNTVLQSGGSIVMKHALVIFHFELAPEKGLEHERDFLYCVNVHDEVQFSVVPDKAEAVGKAFADAIRIAGERLKVRCPLAGSYDIGFNWYETHS